MPALGYDLQFIRARHLALELAHCHPHGVLEVLRCDDLRYLHVQCLVARVSGDPFAGAIERSKVAVEIMRVYQIVRVLEKITESGLAALESFLRPLPFSDVANDAREKTPTVFVILGE